jgi:hypothetical protein
MKRMIAAAALAFATLATPTLAQEESFSCLITFGSVEDAQAGADATALSGEYLPTAEAQALADDSEGLARVFDYSEEFPVNADEEAFCEGPTFNPDDGDGDGDGNGAANSARAFAPGQLKGEGESARDFAPGQMKGDGESAKDSAPGQQKKAD